MFSQMLADCIERCGRVLAYLFAVLVAFLLLVPFYARPAQAQEVPRAALKYRAELTRIAHAEWGLDAPIAAFAAQIHQESGWNPNAVSHVGAQGMAQFMPATAKWFCDLRGLSVAECQPTNPAWAMRSLVAYDRWLFDRVRGASEFDRLWAALRAYNGGLGHWQMEAAAARPATDRKAIDAACGKARRHVSHCAENLGYPQRILVALQPRYATFGRMVGT